MPTCQSYKNNFSIDGPSFQVTIVWINSGKTNHHKYTAWITTTDLQYPKEKKSKGIFINLSPKSRWGEPTRVLLYFLLTSPATSPSLHRTSCFQPHPSPSCPCFHLSSTFLLQTNAFCFHKVVLPGILLLPRENHNKGQKNHLNVFWWRKLLPKVRLIHLYQEREKTNTVFSIITSYTRNSVTRK